MPAEKRVEAAIDLVRQQLARVLSIRPVDVPSDAPLQELGLDSLTGLEVRSALSRATGVTLPATLALDHPTPRAIATYVTERLTGASASSTSGGASHAAAQNGSPPSTEDDVARGDCVQPLAAPQLRLFCFHDAAGSAAMFAPFAELAAAGIEVHTISHTRSAHHGEDIGQRYLDQATAYIAARSDRPYALFGHSLGALFALRVTQQLAGMRVAQPLVYVPSAPPVRILNKTLRKGDIEGVFDLIFGDQHRQLNTVRSDFAADVKLWQYLPELGNAPLPIPIAAFVGSDDHTVSEADVRAWGGHVAHGFSLTSMPGNHFYLYQADARELLIAELQALLYTAQARHQTVRLMQSRVLQRSASE
jgi:surfactin synthase thioesterase subunit/acyl carrier protein